METPIVRKNVIDRRPNTANPPAEAWGTCPALANLRHNRPVHNRRGRGRLYNGSSLRISWGMSPRSILFFGKKINECPWYFRQFER
jgi:hypothetical protein